jgi:hypothetical protein
MLEIRSELQHHIVKVLSGIRNTYLAEHDLPLSSFPSIPSDISLSVT